jgi:hypothetical protein
MLFARHLVVLYCMLDVVVKTFLPRTDHTEELGKHCLFMWIHYEILHSA